MSAQLTNIPKSQVRNKHKFELRMYVTDKKTGKKRNGYFGSGRDELALAYKYDELVREGTSGGRGVPGMPPNPCPSPNVNEAQHDPT